MNKRLISFADYHCQITAPASWLAVIDKYYPTFVQKPTSKEYNYQLLIRQEKSAAKHLDDSLRLQYEVESKRLTLSASFDPFTAFPMLDRAIKKIFTYAFWDQDGLLLHASALAYQGKAYIFIGKGGAGKSTIIQNVLRHSDVDILSDNEIFIKFVDGKVFCYANPFIELSNYRRAALIAETSYPLTSIFKITQSKVNKITPLTLKDLLNNQEIDIFVPPWGKKSIINKQLSQKLLAIYQVNSYKQLYFTKDMDFISLISQYETH